ncbi:MAG TPA: DUF916 domain-containing protein [Ktedonobacteraceae bacterium]|nr:DUF916 domain-containing protein [Ktedonobacteraceae bacterium]
MRKLVIEKSHISIRLLSLQLLGALLLMVSLSISHRTVHAQSTDSQPNFALQPTTYNPKIPVTRSYFVLNTKPGTTLSENIRVTNVGMATGSVRLYPVSATTAQTSGIAYLSRNDALHDVASWIKMGQQPVTLAPGQSQIVPFQISVPASALPGQHVSGITAENLTLQNGSTKGSLHINLQHLSVMAVQVNVPGPTVEQMAVTGIKASGSSGYQSLLVALSNTGNQMLKLTGELKVRSAQGLLLQDLPVKMDTLLPDTSINYPVYVQKKALAAGVYQVSLHLNYGHGKFLDYTTNLTITQEQVNQAFSNGPLQAPTSSTMMPLWQMILVALAALIIVLMGGKKVYDLIVARRRKQAESSDQSIDISNRKDPVLK